MFHHLGVARFARAACPGLRPPVVGLAESQAPPTLFVSCSGWLDDIGEGNVDVPVEVGAPADAAG